jgi:hypothetical protein
MCVCVRDGSRAIFGARPRPLLQRCLGALLMLAVPVICCCQCCARAKLYATPVRAREVAHRARGRWHQFELALAQPFYVYARGVLLRMPVLCPHTTACHCSARTCTPLLGSRPSGAPRHQLESAAALPARNCNPHATATRTQLHVTPVPAIALRCWPAGAAAGLRCAAGGAVVE